MIFQEDYTYEVHCLSWLKFKTQVSRYSRKSRCLQTINKISLYCMYISICKHEPLILVIDDDKQVPYDI